MLDGLTGADAWPWVVLVACAGVTYSARWLGVMLSGRVNAGDEIFKWVNCVAWAMLGALVARLILLPSGPLATVPLSTRVICAALAFASYRLIWRNALFGIAVGVGAIMAFTATGFKLL